MKLKIAVLTLSLGCLAVGGCAQVSPWMAQNGWMSKADMQTQGDNLIKEGQQLKADAANLKAGEFSMMKMRTKEQMLTDGDQMIKDGQMMKSKAASM
jgi:hypothetical protein